MRKLDQRGVVGFEFALVAAPLFILFFVIIDFARYAITVQSLNALASVEYRAWVISCDGPRRLGLTPNCLNDYLSTQQKQTVAPFLYVGGLSATASVTTTTGTSPTVTVTAKSPDFPMIVIWGTALSSPSITITMPY